MNMANRRGWVAPLGFVLLSLCLANCSGNGARSSESAINTQDGVIVLVPTLPNVASSRGGPATNVVGEIGLGSVNDIDLANVNLNIPPVAGTLRDELRLVGILL